MRKIEVSGEIVVGNVPEVFNVSLTMSDCPFEFIKGNLRYRYLDEAIRKKLKKSFSYIRSFNIEKAEQTNEVASFYGKSIFEMSKSELRDMCCEFCYMNVDTETSQELVQQQTAEEWLKRKLGYNSIKDTAFYIYNSKDNTSYIDYNAMKSEEAKELFMVKLEDKPKDKQNVETYKKISVAEMVNKLKSEPKKNLAKNKTKEKEVEEQEDDLISLKK